MALHVFGSIITAQGVAANNRGENEGNITTLQKLLWNDQVHTTVSSEAIRWAIRYYWQVVGLGVNRVWNDEKEDHEWQDESFSAWSKDTGETFIDDDVLGFMKAEGGKSEGEKGHADKRRGVLEIARAISVTPFVGDITFNAKSGKKGRTSLYGTEVHATRYQYGFALTPLRLRNPSRVEAILDALCNLGEVAGNHSRFLYDFSPESVVLRITEDPAPRLLYCFEQGSDGGIAAPALADKVAARDIAANELILGGAISRNDELQALDVRSDPSVKGAFEALKARVVGQIAGKK